MYANFKRYYRILWKYRKENIQGLKINFKRISIFKIKVQKNIIIRGNLF